MTEKEFNTKWVELALILMIAGVEIKCEQSTSLFEKTVFKISVPEKHELIEEYIPEEMMKEVKEEISKLVYKLCEAETDEDKEIVKESFKVLGNVRNETWTQEKYDNKKAQINKELELLSAYAGYKEI